MCTVDSRRWAWSSMAIDAKVRGSGQQSCTASQGRFNLQNPPNCYRISPPLSTHSASRTQRLQTTSTSATDSHNYPATDSLLLPSCRMTNYRSDIRRGNKTAIARPATPARQDQSSYSYSPTSIALYIVNPSYWYVNTYLELLRHPGRLSPAAPTPAYNWLT